MPSDILLLSLGPTAAVTCKVSAVLVGALAGEVLSADALALAAAASAINLLTPNQAGAETDTTGMEAVNGTLSRDTTAFYAGTASFKLVVAAAGDAQIRATYTAVTAALPYAFSVYVKATAAVGRMWKVRIEWFDAIGTSLGVQDSLATLASASWTCLYVAGVAPGAEPITLAQAKGQTRVETSDEDPNIASLIATARAYVEETTGRALLTQTWTWQHVNWHTLFSGSWSRLSHGAWGRKVIVPRPPLQSATITYLDANNVLRTLAPTEYVVTPGDPGTIERSSAFSWPTVASSGYPVTITFCAGYGTAAKIPGPLTQAMLLLIEEWYGNRSSIVAASRTSLLALPHAVEALLALYHWYL
jgi:uncharacterized phiE125 gp8 family phage protein